jgi:hypothetical protein
MAALLKQGEGSDVALVLPLFSTHLSGKFRNDKDTLWMLKDRLYPISARFLVIELNQRRSVKEKRATHKRSSRSAMRSCAQLLLEVESNCRVFL